MKPEATFVPGQDAANAAALYLRLQRLITAGVIVPTSRLTIDVQRLRDVLRICRRHGIRPQQEVVARELGKLLEPAVRS